MGPTEPLKQAFPKKLRLLQRRDFVKTGRKGRRVHTGGVVFLVDRNTLPFTRIGITTGKQSGKAVRRNRAKRIIREYFRLNRNRFAAGFDIVVIVKDARALGVPETVERNFEQLFRKAAFVNQAVSAGRDRPGSAGLL